MNAPSVIASDSSQFGEWHELVLPSALSEAHQEKLLMSGCGQLTMRRAGREVQVFCRETSLADIYLLVNQIVADIILRERIAELAAVQLNDLVEGALCRVLSE